MTFFALFFIEYLLAHARRGSQWWQLKQEMVDCIDVLGSTVLIPPQADVPAQAAPTPGQQFNLRFGPISATPHSVNLKIGI